ncbi:MAG TPA: T9SS type A sorting domain-containing protein [Flavobacterium sp.]|nr:T9SS type A sorting domain-containing protein [Flavobacterium sp.]
MKNLNCTSKSSINYSYKANTPFSYKKLFYFVFLFILTFTFSSNSSKKWIDPILKKFQYWEWTEVNKKSEWKPRAGLQAIDHNGALYVMGGRTPIDPMIINVPGASTIWGDVWKSNDKGKSWSQILETDDKSHWPARAYFQAVNNNKYMYIIGGQNFNIIDNPGLPFCLPDCLPKIPKSDFFNDVWRSEDGIKWTNLTNNIPSEKRFSPRAGLSAVIFNNEIYVMGGSVNDDSSITPSGPARIYYNDVWKSKDGKNWQCITKNAPWSPRAGGVAVVKNGYLYMIGGEDGFICNPSTPRCPPYYNDVWRTKDGKKWEVVTKSAQWSARPGHQVVVADNRFVLFGGFGLDPNFNPSVYPPQKYVPSNPMDVWVSKDGKDWKKLKDAPWNAKTPADIKYDFDALVLKGSNEFHKDAIYTFGGDRETFDFLDFTNYLNVDNDVWRFSLPKLNKEDDSIDKNLVEISSKKLELVQNYPNPFNNSTKISYKITNKALIKIYIYNVNGELVKNLITENKPVGTYEVEWNGKNNNNSPVNKGIYIAKIWADNEMKTIKLILK